MASSQHPSLTELHILFHFIFYENSLSQQLSNVPHSGAVMAPRCASRPQDFFALQVCAFGATPHSRCPRDARCWPWGPWVA